MVKMRHICVKILVFRTLYYVHLCNENVKPNLKKRKNEKVTNYIILTEPLFISILGARLSFLSIAQSYR
jgi:hypothetical protein